MKKLSLIVAMAFGLCLASQSYAQDGPMEKKKDRKADKKAVKMEKKEAKGSDRKAMKKKEKSERKEDKAEMKDEQHK